MTRFYIETKDPDATVADQFIADYIDATDEQAAKAELEQRGIKLIYIEEVVE